MNPCMANLYALPQILGVGREHHLGRENCGHYQRKSARRIIAARSSLSLPGAPGYFAAQAPSSRANPMAAMQRVPAAQAASDRMNRRKTRWG